MKSCRIVSASRNHGKTTYMERLIKEDINGYGFLSIKGCNEYSLLDIRSGIQRIYISDKPISSNRFGKWFVDYSVFDWVYENIKKIPSGSNVYLDEVGLIEVEGNGYFKTLQYLLSKDMNLTIAVRSEFVPIVIDKFSINDYQLIEVPCLIL